MTNLMLEAYDKFVALYDLVVLIKEGADSDSTLASSAQVSHSVSSQMLTFMLAQGYIKTLRNDSEFKVTVLGLNFLEEFKGMRKFLS